MLSKEYFEAISHESLVGMAVILAEKDEIHHNIIKELSERTCESCKFAKKRTDEEYYDCSSISVNDNLTLGGSPLVVKKDFSCNRWEKK